jgi:glycine/D-amino acid oxidase-like deaminating enzyme
VGKADADVLVVGAGVWGLAIAFALAGTGRAVTLLEAEIPGAGASGGAVGALAPFAPEPWDARKAFQLEALRAAPADWAAVADASGLDPGFARCGRLVPLATAAARARAEAGAAAAATAWGRAAAWRILDRPPDPAWLAPPACGVLHDTLSAGIVPRLAVAALATALRVRGGAILTGWRADAVEPGRVRAVDGRVLRAPEIVVAAGAGTATLLGLPLLPGVRGEALLLDAAAPPGAPVIAGGGLYVVPQPGRGVAVGATSERPGGPPCPTLDALLARARSLCPNIAEAAVLERWGAVRPRGLGPDPLVGRIAPDLVVATGGYKIGFALAHAVARAVKATLDGAADGLPPAWRPAT